MASGLGGIFDSKEAKGQQMAAPGIPAGALSGNPTASFVNTFLAGGANVGASLGGALGELVGLETVNPQQLAQDRANEFAQEFQTITAEGKVMQGEALRLAAQKQYQAGRLAPDEYLKAIAEANKQKEQDNKLLSDTTTFINKNKLVDEYRVAKSTHDQLINTAKDKPSSANDFLLIQQGLKILDPTSIVSKSEIAQGRLSAVGAQELSALGFNVNQLINYAAYGGKKPLLSDSMKERWLGAIGRKVDAQRNTALEIYSSAYDQFTSNGGPDPLFKQATASTARLLSGTDQAELVKNEAGDFTHGGMSENFEGRLGKAFGAVTDMWKSSGVGAGGRKVGPEWLGLSLTAGSPASWVADNLGILGDAGENNSSAALAVAPIESQKRLRDTHGETGPLGLAIDSALGDPALGPLNDAVILGTHKALPRPKKRSGGF